MHVRGAVRIGGIGRIWIAIVSSRVWRLRVKPGMGVNMLTVVELEDARSMPLQRFADYAVRRTCVVSLDEALGRVIACDVVASEGVPPFDRSTMDGFAVVASDTFGCSEALPAMLTLAGEVDMGVAPTCTCLPGTCVRIPTGGQMPQGANAVVMLERCEEYGDGTVGIMKAVAPGDNMVFRYDDVKPGQPVLFAGTKLDPHHVGSLASMGITECSVFDAVTVGIISTGDEIVDAACEPIGAQMRDVNAPMLASAVQACGARPIRYPIVPDEYEALLHAVRRALGECDMVLISGGSSAGQRDNTARVLSELGSLLYHGVAVKPGKPTMCADVQGKPAFGLPGHPVAAYFMFLEAVRPLLARMCGTSGRHGRRVCVRLREGIPSNHGRSEIVAVRLEGEPDVVPALESESGHAVLSQGDACGNEPSAIPVRSKSGLISSLASADGYIVVGRNTEGVPAGQAVEVRLF